MLVMIKNRKEWFKFIRQYYIIMHVGADFSLSASIIIKEVCSCSN
jgi:hypothetical protein